MQDIKKDLDFLKEMKSHFEDIEDTSQYEYGINMINDWISELEEKLTTHNSDYRCTPSGDIKTSDSRKRCTKLKKRG